MTAIAHPRAALANFEFVAMMAMLMALQALGIDTMLPALPQIAGALGEPDANRRQLVVGTYLIAAGIGSLFYGSLADRFGRRPIILLAIGGYVLMAIACAITRSFDMLLVLRFGNGLIGAGAGVVANAIIRDRFEGDQMARVTSTIAIVFMTVPILAPALGQGVLLFAGWRTIFVVLAMLAAAVWLWVWLRLPETLRNEDRQTLQIGQIAHSFRLIVTNRDSAGYIIGSTLVFAGLYGFINSSQQLLAEHFAMGTYFPLAFAAMASTMAATSFVNSRIVERFGARPVSHFALIIFVLAASAQVAAAQFAPDSVLLFMPMMMINFAMIGFLGANFTAIALQPFARIAGSASSLQTTLRIGGGAVLGALIGAAYDGTAFPLAAAMLCLSLGALLAVAFSERYRLFRRRAGAIAKV